MSTDNPRTDLIRYDILARDALRGVLRQVLTDAAEYGLPGEHHFFITFLTQAPGVKISPRLLAQYPQEITIVLQHQFWDLRVTNELFEVGLSFNGIPERLVVPFDAIKGFFDPSVQFGLQFETGESEDAAAPEASDSGDTAQPELPRTETAQHAPATASADPSDDETPSEGAQVVRLDRFRKK